MTGTCVLRETILRVVRGWSARFSFIYLILSLYLPDKIDTISYLIILALSRLRPVQNTPQIVRCLSVKARSIGMPAPRPMLPARLAAALAWLPAALAASGTSASSRSRRNQAPPPPDDDVLRLLSGMSLRQKVGQMTQIDVTQLVSYTGSCRTNSLWEDPVNCQPELNYDRLRSWLQDYQIGSILNSPYSAKCIKDKCGWDVHEWRAFVRTVQQEARALGVVPPLFGLDTIHGANYVHGATTMPQQTLTRTLALTLTRALTLNPHPNPNPHQARR